MNIEQLQAKLLIGFLF